jgi:ribonucleoside-diphosphate reductase subunit M2
MIHQIWKTYKNAESHFWSAEEIEFFDDVTGLEKMTGKERAALFHALATLSANPALEGEPIFTRLSDEIQVDSFIYSFFTL